MAIPNVALLLLRPVVWSAVLGWLLLALALHRPLVARYRLAPAPTLLALLSAATIAVVTLTPDGWYRLGTVRDCVRDPAFGRVLAGAPEVFNVAMFVPLGFALVLVARRVAPAVVTVTLLPVLIELFQASFAQRVCTVLDWIDNTAGGLIGVAAGAVVVEVTRRRRPRPESAPRQHQ